jgi:hypothetical protein
MKQLIARCSVLVLLLSGLIAVGASAPAVAHSGSCTVTGNTWYENRDAGRFALGSGNVDCSQVHSSIYIKVTLQYYEGGFWVNLANADKGPTPQVRSLYKQTSDRCSQFGTRTFRVMIFYQTTGNAHSGTVFRGQEQQPCLPVGVG